MVASESGRGVDGMDGRGEAGCVSPNGSDGKRDIVADSMPVLREGAIVVAKVFDGAKGTPLNGRRSMFSSRMAQKRSLAAEACTPDLWGWKAAINAGGTSWSARMGIKCVRFIKDMWRRPTRSASQPT